MIDPPRYPLFHGYLNSAGVDQFGCCLQIPAAREWTGGPAFTLEGWARWDGSGVFQVLFGKALRRSAGHVADGLWLRLESGVPTLRLPTSRGVRTVDYRREAQLPANRWTHVAATYDGRTAILYRDGREVARGAWPDTADLQLGAEPLTIGGEFEVDDDRAALKDTVLSRSLAGGMSLVRLWRNALPAESLARWSGRENLEGHPQLDALIAQWPLDEGTGLTLRSSRDRKWDGRFLFGGDPVATDPWWVPQTPGGGARPGAMPTGNVDLATGRVTLSLPLLGVEELRGVGAQVELQYESSVEGSVDVWNLEAPTGLVGMGWTLTSELIIRDPHGDASPQNDTYLLVTKEGGTPLICGGSDPEGEIYFARSAPNWKIRYQPQYELWTVIREDGSRSYFGGNDATPFGAGRSIEWSVAWGNWLGVSTTPNGQRRYASVWNLSCRENSFEDRVLFAYEQDLLPVGRDGAGRQSFTAACRLQTITGPWGDRVVLKYSPKAADEYQRWDVAPDRAPGEDGYQDRLDNRFLSSVELYGRLGTLLRTVELAYTRLGSGPVVKRYLKSVQAKNGASLPADPGHQFAYFGEDGRDGVSAALNGPGRLFNPDTGALYGALRSRTVPEGAIYTYRYAQVTFADACRDLEITAPDTNWGYPYTYFGPDYLVVLWCGLGNTIGKMYVRVFTWTGGWTMSDVGVIDVTHNRPALVETRNQFFAVFAHGQRVPLLLFTRSALKIGEWEKTPFEIAGTTVTTVVGERFVAWLDQETRLVTRVSRKGTGWNTSTVTLQGGADAKFTIAAEGETLCTVSANPNNAPPPEFCLYRLNHLDEWLESRQAPGFEYAPSKGSSSTGYVDTTRSGLKELSLNLGSGFAVVQGFYSTDERAQRSRNYTNYFPLCLHRWDEEGRLANVQNLAPLLEQGAPSDDRPRVIALGSMVLVDFVGTTTRHVHHFTGDGWNYITYSHDSLNNNFVGADCFASTRHGSAQFYEWNPTLGRWDARIPAYPDGNPTYWDKVWKYLYYAEMILTLPLSWEVALPLDLAFLFTDMLVEQLANPGLATSRANRFFAAGSQLYYRQPNGNWARIGSLVDEYSGRSVGEWTESVKLTVHSTQAASGFVIYSVETDRSKIVTTTQGHEIHTHTEHQAGYPRTTQSITLLKNGARFGEPLGIAPPESALRNGDSSEVFGPNAFLTYVGRNLHESSRMRLHRVINDAISGPLYGYVAASETVNDGWGDVYTHYQFRKGAAHPSGHGGLFHQATVVYSGASATADFANGYADHYFFTGRPLQFTQPDLLPPGQDWSQYPAIVAGHPYLSRTFRMDGGNLVMDSSRRTTWSVKTTTLAGRERAYTARVTRLETLENGQSQTIDTTFDDADRGFPSRITTSNLNLDGREEKSVTSYAYAWRFYPELVKQNVLTEVAETRLTVNDRLVEGSRAVWDELRSARPAEPNRWNGLQYSVWGVRGTFQATGPDAAAITSGNAPQGGGWLRTMSVRGVLPSGVPAEMGDVDGVITSTLYDRNAHAAIASFVGASVSGGQAGYLGFGESEDAAAWQLEGSLEPKKLSHTGVGYLSGAAALAKPKKFEPRREVCYVVGAWISMRAGGAGAVLGFGTRSRTVPAEPGWRYVEYVDLRPEGSAAPFVRCDGSIDCLWFGPADAAFTAATYDTDYGSALTHLDSHGNVTRSSYDQFQELMLEIGPDDLPRRFYGRRHASQLGRSLHSARLPENDQAALSPHARLVVTAQESGCYAQRTMRLLGGNDTLTVLPKPTGPVGSAVRFSLRQVADARLLVMYGSASIEIAPGTIRVTDQSGNRSQFDGAFESDNFIIAILERRLLLFVGARLVISQEVALPGECTLRSIGTVPTGVRDACSMLSPLLSLTYADGLGREIQTQGMHPNGTGLIASQLLYDGWGHAAVRTAAIPIGWAARYQPGLVTYYDWNSGLLSGAISRYYRDDALSTVDGLQDADFACVREVVERSPRAKTLEATLPGKQGSPGRGGTLRTDYSRNPDAQWLYNQVGLTPSDAYRSVTRYFPLAPSRQTATTEIFDRAGNRLAQSAGAGPERTAASYLRQRVNDGWETVTFPPNLHRSGKPDRAAAGASFRRLDFRHHPEVHSDPDSGTLQRITDTIGRLRFILDPMGAARSPVSFHYFTYDAVGRPVEYGRFSAAWDRKALRDRADGNTAWPSKEPGAEWFVRWFYDSDGSPETIHAHGRLRELYARGEDGQVVAERYTYDAQGRQTQVELRVPGFDNQGRVIRYEYDALNRIKAISYPGFRERTVRHQYNAGGRLWRIGEGDQPALYAEYEYLPDGAVACEFLNNRRFQSRYRYDFQGRLLQVDVSGQSKTPLYRAALEYGEGGGDAALTSVRFSASAAVPQAHRYCYIYNSLSRVSAAIAEPLDGAPRHPEWDLTGEPTGFVTLDPNGNLQARREGGVGSVYSYAPNTNRLDAINGPGQAPQRLQYDANGRLTAFGSVRNLTYTAGLVVPASAETPAGPMRLYYNGNGRRVLKQVGDRKKLYVRGKSNLTLAEFTGNPAEETHYIHGIGGLSAYVRSGKSYFVIRDHQGSTRLVIDGEGRSVANFNYLPYGGLQVQGSTPLAAAPIPYLYTGQEYDPELGCYNYRARLYDPVVGRFLAPDPAGEWFNPYAYVGNNPLNRTDPSGLLSRPLMRLLLGITYAGVYAGIGYGIGQNLGRTAEERQANAWTGFYIGAGIGAFRGLVEAGYGLWRSRNFLRAANERYPIIVYYEAQKIGCLDTGRLGAELLAEGAGIPRNRWGSHLVSTEVRGRVGFAWPNAAQYNGHLIAVGHGEAKFGFAELGLPGANQGFSDGDALRDFLSPGIRNATQHVDLSICHAQTTGGFAPAVQTSFGNGVGVHAGRGTVSPLAPWFSSGTVREVGYFTNFAEMVTGLPAFWWKVF